MLRPTIAALAFALSLLPTLTVAQAPANDYACRSTTHPNPVILLHGLGATRDEDLNRLQSHLNARSFCTFSLTYGADPRFPFVGGLKPIDDSAAEIAAFVADVLRRTDAAHVDLVGHSEGGFQALYVPKFRPELRGRVARVLAIAPPSHGTLFLLWAFALAYVGGALTRELTGEVLETVGCPACDDLSIGGGAVGRLNQGPIVQEGVEYTILASRYDELVTPTETSFVREPGVRNLYVQDFCKSDPVGHIGLAYDLNVWEVVVNTLSGSSAGPKVCSFGSPGK